MTFYNNILFSKLHSKIENISSTSLVRFEHGGGKIESSHKVNNLEKRFLVWTKRYKTIDEIPPHVSQSTMERCRNRMRIKIANYMMAATAVGCIAMIYLGKQDAKKGISLTQQNRDWHAQNRANIAADSSK